VRADEFERTRAFVHPALVGVDDVERRIAVLDDPAQLGPEFGRTVRRTRDPQAHRVADADGCRGKRDRDSIAGHIGDRSLRFVDQLTVLPLEADGHKSLGARRGEARGDPHAGDAIGGK